MPTDVAIAIASWTAAQDALLDAQQRLAAAERSTALGEAPPPIALRAEVQQRREVSERLLAFAMVVVQGRAAARTIGR